MKEIVAGLISKNSGLSIEEVTKLIEVPPKIEMGDYSFPCFSLAKTEKKSPIEIAKDLLAKINSKLPKEIEKASIIGPYINFFIDKRVLVKEVLLKVKKKDWGKSVFKKVAVGIEYPGPNTNKALHIGHLRNMAIGESILNLNNFMGNNTYHLNIFNDRGILISKSMLAYEKYAFGKTPKSERIKGDKFVGELYTRFSIESEKDPKLEEQAQEVLRLWEGKDKKTIELWKKMNSWAYEGMEETFRRFGLSKIDKSYYESEMYEKGREIILEGLKKGLFYKKEDGAVAINLEQEKLGEKVLLRKDGTSVYITQDLYLAEKRVNDFNLDASYYVVASEQEYHFKVLFSILEKLGIKKNWKHLSYGMISLPSGKMSSRQGSIVLADDLIDEIKALAKEGIMKRGYSGKDIDYRAEKIALAAIKYSLLKIDINKGIVFNPNESVNFEGDTGTYLLYSYARANSILNKVKSKKKILIEKLEQGEVKLVKKIEEFPSIIKKAYTELAPNLIANYAYELCQVFNEFYHNCPVLGSESEGFRLSLVDAFRRTIKKGLDLLGIETLEEV
jgi:arginyl-tRNA synthetase